MKVGITGSTGGLGRRLVEKLLENNFKIKALVRKTSKTENLPGNIEFCYGDICKTDDLNEFVKDIDVLFHLAAQVSFVSRKQYYDINLNGTKNICEAVIKYNPSCKLIHCSTISTLKVNPKFKFKTNDYGLSKYFAEQYVLDKITNKEIKGTIIYPGLIYGPYDKNVVPSIMYYLKKGQARLIKGGEEKVPLIYIDELCDLFIKAAVSDKASGKRYISVKGMDIGVHEFVKMIAEKMNLNVSEKIHNKKLLLFKAFYFELLYKLLKKKEKPPIFRSYVNIFSINFNTYKIQQYDDAFKDLEWSQTISKDFVDKTLDISLNWFNEQQNK